MKKSTGICVGASTVKIVEIDQDYQITRKHFCIHDCNPKKALQEILKDLDFSNSHVAVTGRKFKNLLNLPTITEPEATEAALRWLGNAEDSYTALVSLGSENFIVYVLDSQRGIIEVKTGNKCASGTGEFFLQQTRRMGMEVEEAVKAATDCEPHHVSGRCSVFCKSDCTHALNLGTPRGKVAAGLVEMMSNKVMDLLSGLPKSNIILVGGVTQNTSVVQNLKEQISPLHIPEEADCFEAWGAAIAAMENKMVAGGVVKVRQELNSFSTLSPLIDYKDWVEFKQHPRGTLQNGDECILGLDVGSTTTKAVLVRTRDNAVLGDIYLRTNGDPVNASRECYKAIHEGTNGNSVNIIGLGVCGSGRNIAGLHAMTDGIINEIIAHATGATFYDPDVDTILEIGGQDAKYTYLVNGVPCDYAMNEACSAGTGSFLEEAAKEAMGIDYRDIHKIAMQGNNPPNFNDQCAAFISSDIKNASHEDIAREDIVAGLVYSICMNYTNRVKGPRKVGDKVFMQGGVCYNSAVPLAMASLLQKPIIVPPDPGLIGAFGVALEVKRRLESGLMKPSSFDLEELMNRDVTYGKTFTCNGMPEKCDRGCQINVIKIKGKNYAFGGICNKYYNIQHHISVASKEMDVVARRQALLFTDVTRPPGKNGKPKIKRIGMTKSFYQNNLYPLYQTYFKQLGIEIVMGDETDQEGVSRATSSFCFPAQIAHGMFQDLLKKKPDAIFLPKISQLYVRNSKARGYAKHSTCCLAAAEPFYLRSVFQETPVPILSPTFEFHNGWDAMVDEFVKLGLDLGCNPVDAEQAYMDGVKKLEEFERDKKALGDDVLIALEDNPDAVGIVLFGRTYNTFAKEANFGIPRKFSTRGVYVLPYDCLRFENEESMENMSWAAGHDIMRGVRLVKKHPQLFAAYVTNFSCGPDSFMVGYMRDLMGNKPSLTLELDSHTADAGINTRVEAFLDIVQRYLNMQVADNVVPTFRPASVSRHDGDWHFSDSDGNEHSFHDPRVKVLVPSMGHFTAELAAAAFRGMGINAEPIPIPDFPTLMIGRANTSCKECIPLILTTAGLLDYVESRKEPDELTAFFMPGATGSCRLAQYTTFQNRLIKKKQMRNVALFNLQNENSYEGMTFSQTMLVLKAIVAADTLDEIRNALLVLPKNKELAQEIFDRELQNVVRSLEDGGKDFFKALKGMAKALKKVDKRIPIEKARKVLLNGEIYVRKDEFMTQGLVERLATKDIITVRAPLMEWVAFIGYNARYLQRRKVSRSVILTAWIQSFITRYVERKTKRTLAESGFYKPHFIDIGAIIKDGQNFVDTVNTGEILLVIGTFFREIAHEVHGVVHVGPFACLPTRIIESIITSESQNHLKKNERIRKVSNFKNLSRYHVLPNVSIEMDGNPLPQIVEARIEAFALQVDKLYKQMQHN
ncbi:MAG: acyl-CoA dehydratase activase [Puniceicoccaceae bacterium]